MPASKQISDILNTAMAHHKAGRLDDAEAHYLSALDLDKNNPNALTMLGALAHKRGNSAQAIEFFNRALAASPQFISALFNRAVVLEQSGRAQDALSAYRACLMVSPDHSEAAMNLGALLHDQADFIAAKAVFQKLLTLQPGNPRVHCNLGQCLFSANDRDGAYTHLTTALMLDSRSTPALLTLSNLYADLLQFDDAIRTIKQAIVIEPDNPEFQSVLGNSLLRAGQNDAAIESQRRACALAPQNPKFLNNLGAAFLERGQPEEARKALSEAVKYDPLYTDAHFNLAHALDECGQPDPAIDALEAALALRPGHAEAYKALSVLYAGMGLGAVAHLCLEHAKHLEPTNPRIIYADGLARLTKGDFGAGWLAYEERFVIWNSARFRHKSERSLSEPPAYWNGEPLSGRRIRVWTEQGIGDEILYAGMLPHLTAQGAEVILECSPRMVPVFTRSFPSIQVQPISSDSDDAWSGEQQFHSSLGSLGRFLRPSFSSFPTRRSYLRADEQSPAKLRSQYGPGPLVGISWRSEAPRLKRKKSIDLATWSPILKIPGVKFVNLQYGDRTEELRAVEQALGIEIIQDPSVNQLQDMDAFFAQVVAMDLVISISNATAHVAGALGRPTWVMLPQGAGSLWHWFENRNDSPWYPSARLFRQSKVPEVQGAFSTCVEAVGAALQEWVLNPIR